MPFTFSHPAAVLPLGYFPKRFFSMTGLIIGSMAPDFEYFIRLKDRSYYSHTWTGLFWFDLPLTIILSFAFHQIVRNKLIDNLPAFVSKRFMAFRNFDWPSYFKKNLIVSVVSIIIGVSSHIIWDAITHEKGRIGKEIIRYKEDFMIAGHHLLTYNVLQFGSSVLGGLVLLYVLFKLPVSKSFTRQNSVLPYWLPVGIIMFLVIAAKIFMSAHYISYHDMIVTIISGGLLGLLLTSIFLPAKSKLN